MKKLLALLLVLCLLTGCTVIPGGTETTAPSQTTAPIVFPSNSTQPSQETEPSVPATDPYEGMTKAEFYKNYIPATSYQDAQFRSKHGFLSGTLEVPGSDFVRAENQPMSGGKYIRNGDSYYADGGNTYIVVDADGNEVMRLYKGGAYITLEEVAAYMYAFGGTAQDLPANYTTKKSTKPSASIWGEYLRCNHSNYSNNTSKYPYEPKLPEKSGTKYYEMDIGTTGTVTPGYAAKPYNDGSKITRGAARLVYTRQDLDRDGTIEADEIFVFYTNNHYNDFTEYLNYYGGWGQTFGNVTGGGVYDSDTQCNPTPYPSVVIDSLRQAAAA